MAGRALRVPSAAEKPVGDGSRSVRAHTTVQATDLKSPSEATGPRILAGPGRRWRFFRAPRMLGSVGLIALVLASIGVYGVMTYSVTERTHEIGVRVALGAQQGDVLRLVLRHGILMTGIGLLIGLPLSVGLSHLLAELIYGVSSVDFATFGGVTVLMCAITLLACYVPARRAARVDPPVALRYE